MHTCFVFYYLLLVSIVCVSVIAPASGGQLAEHQACSGGSGSMMDLLMLSRIDEELGSSEVDALCFLCLDVVNRKRLEGVSTTYLVLLPLELSLKDRVLPLSDFFSPNIYNPIKYFCKALPKQNCQSSSQSWQAKEMETVIER